MQRSHKWNVRLPSSLNWSLVRVDGQESLRRGRRRLLLGPSCPTDGPAPSLGRRRRPLHRRAGGILILMDLRATYARRCIPRGRISVSSQATCAECWIIGWVRVAELLPPYVFLGTWSVFSILTGSPCCAQKVQRCWNRSSLILLLIGSSALQQKTQRCLESVLSFTLCVC